MCSKCSASSVASQLAASLIQVSDSDPSGYRRLIERVGELDVELQVCDEVMSLEFTTDAVHVYRRHGASPDAVVLTTRATIDDVISGGQTLEEAILDGQLIVKGPLDVLVRLHDGLLLYLTSVIRSSRHPRSLVE